MRYLALTILALAIPASVQAGGKALPADLAFVPPDAGGFIHVRLQDVWKSEHLSEWRTTVQKAGKDLLTAFDARFFPHPSTLERLTIIVSTPKDMEEPVFVIAASKTIDRASFMKYTVPGAREEIEGRATFLVDARKKVEIYFVDDKTLAVGPPGSVRRLLAQPNPATGTLTPALKLAAKGKPIVAAINPQALKAEAMRGVPPAIRPLFNCKLATLAIDFQQEGHVELQVSYANAAQAAAGESAAREGIKLGRAKLAEIRAEMEKKVIGNGKPGTLDELPEAAVSLLLLGSINRADDFVAKLPLKKTGNALAMSLKMPPGTQAIASGYLATSALGFVFFTSRPAVAEQAKPLPPIEENKIKGKF